jgi:ABC-type uncharacterized transport system involved in gliding motility auxiliary subunit
MEQSTTTGTYTLGAALSGVFPSFFRNQEKPVREGSEETLPDMPATGAETRIIVLGDTDVVGSNIRLTGAQKNLDFFVNAADYLGSDDDIISIRNRAAAGGRLDAIADPDARAAAMAWARVLNVVLIPALVIVLGIVLAMSRRRKLKAEAV